MLSNTKCVLSSEPVSNKDVTIDKTCLCHLVKSQVIRPSEHYTSTNPVFFSLHDINKMLKSRIAQISNNSKTSDPYSFINLVYYVIKIWPNRSC